MTREFALSVLIDLPIAEDYPPASQLRKALQDILDRLGNDELVEAVWEVHE